MPEITISTTQAQSSNLNRNKEIFSLTPSSLIALWEIDASALLDDTGLRDYNSNNIFRFHNAVKLTENAIYWRGDKYIAAPIYAEGFEYAGKGSPATPKLSISVNSQGIEALGILKGTLKKLGDLTGARVTRRRVFAKYIDGINFENLTKQELAGQGFSPDPNMQFDVDIFYIDRKSVENKSRIEFELGSIIDVEGVKLPGRICNARRCPWAYRGFGCLYEYQDNRIDFVHGTDSTLPTQAPPIANDKNELIKIGRASCRERV